ncbi:hypothetical protein Cs7R123_49570 [Catellatospora sp. TT07R-123]|nr:hypothetical protein Cs7R123_49570 [Catellatospora sp. TT07R-123]
MARGGALSRTAFLLTGEHHAAEDLVQSALAKAATRWRQIRDGGQPEAYVRRIMINEQISWWRRRPARPVAEVPDRPGPDHGQRVLDRIMLDQALDRLTPRQRATVVLRFYEDLSEADTASVIGCSVGAVKRNTHDALNRLREALPMLAEHAGQYADAGAAVTTAKRRRTGRIAVTAALALLLAAGGYAVFGSRLTRFEPAPPAASPSAFPSPYPPSAPVTLPSSLADRSSTAQPLPEDRGVGRATLLLDALDRRDGYLVGADGTWWRRPQTKPGVYQLSPDGRWLARRDETQVVVRDLVGTAQHTLPRADEVWWAPASGWLYGTTVDGPAWLASLTDWSPHEVDPVTARSFLAVTDAGELLCTAEGTSRTRVPLRLVSPATGAEHELAVDLTGQLGTDEKLAQVSITNVAGGILTPVVVAADGVAAVEFYRHEPGNETVSIASGVIQFSLADGRVLRRVDLVGQDGRQGQLLCFRGGELLWTDKLTLRGVTAGAVTSHTILELKLPRWIHHPAGCPAGALPNQLQ